jgi:tetratricopeptide (TPR) repeat protein
MLDAMRALVFVAATLIAQELPDYDQLRKTARTAYSKGDYTGARQALEQAWELAQHLPAEDPKRYDVLKQLSGVLSAAGDYAAAQTYVELAIGWREAIDKADPKIAEEYTELASLCQRQQNYARSLELLGMSLRIHARQGAPNVLMADDLSRVALIYMEQKKPREATPPLETAISMREQILGAEHPSILSELDRLGAIWIALREYPKAEDTFRKAMIIRERLLGPNDAGLITTVEGLAYSQFGQKKFAEAEPGYQRLLNLWITSTGDSAHPMVAVTLDKIAVFYRAQDRWDEGTEAAERANALRALFFANGLSQEATARQAHGDKKEAAKLFALALASLDESRPEHEELRKQLQQNLEELQIETKPVRKAPAKKK